MVSSRGHDRRLDHELRGIHRPEHVGNLPRGRHKRGRRDNERIRSRHDRASGTSTAAANFTAVGNMTMPRANSTATLLPDGRVLIVGGEQSGPAAELYNPATGTFQASSANMGVLSCY